MILIHQWNITLHFDNWVIFLWINHKKSTHKGRVYYLTQSGSSEKQSPVWFFVYTSRPYIDPEHIKRAENVKNGGSRSTRGGTIWTDPMAGITWHLYNGPVYMFMNEFKHKIDQICWYVYISTSLKSYRYKFNDNNTITVQLP